MGVHYIMSKFVRVERGIVREIIIADVLPEFTPEITAQFVVAPKNVGEGWLYDGVTWVSPPPPLPDPKIALKAQLDLVTTLDGLKTFLKPALGLP